jgi:hypothetical protein
MDYQQAFEYWLNESGGEVSAIYTSLFGYSGGGLTKFFTNWDSAREFTRDRTIASNRNLGPDNQKELLNIEQIAFEKHHDQWFKNDSTEIAEYYNYLANEIPNHTDNIGVINTFIVASGGSGQVADALNVTLEESSRDARNLFTPNDEQAESIKKGLTVVGLLLGGLIVFRLLD